MAKHKFTGANYHLKDECVKIVAHAFKTGQLVRPERCAWCGDYDSIYAHHEDYSRPLDVVWLCGSCHQRRHWWGWTLNKVMWSKTINRILWHKRPKNLRRRIVHPYRRWEKNMSSKHRRPCPDCGQMMVYTFPSNHPDLAIEAELWRFQGCLSCFKQYDIGTWSEHRIMILYETGTLQVDGLQYHGKNLKESLALWVKKLTRKEP